MPPEGHIFVIFKPILWLGSGPGEYFDMNLLQNGSNIRKSQVYVNIS